MPPATSEITGMEPGEYLEGERLVQVIDLLESNRNFLKAGLAEGSNQWLCLVTGQAEKDGLRYFELDLPGSLKPFPYPEGTVFSFEFIGSDRLTYAFVAKVQEARAQSVWFRFPERMERRQRRRDFRIGTGFDPKGILKVGGEERPILIENFSTGGMLFRYAETGAAVPGHPPDSMMEDVELVIRHGKKNLEKRIRIRRCRVCRSEPDERNGGTRFAVHFAELDLDQENRLTQLILSIQRELLRKRLPFPF